MSKIKIEFETDNAAFDDGMGGWPEIQRILEDLAARIARGQIHYSGSGDPIRDINGNLVGKMWKED